MEYLLILSFLVYNIEIITICCIFICDKIYGLFGIHSFYLKSCLCKILSPNNQCSIHEPFCVWLFFLVGGCQFFY